MDLRSALRASLLRAGSALRLGLLLPGLLLALPLPSVLGAGAESRDSAPSEADEPRLWVDRPLASVEVTGLRRTRSFVVRRELRVLPGERLRWPEVESDRLRLLDLGLFAEVRVRSRRDPGSDRPVLVYEIRERPSIALLPVLEYDPEDGVSYGFYFGERNFRGRAERIAVSGVLGGRRAAGLAYGVPWVGARRIGLGASVFISERDKETERIRERKHGIQLSVSPARDYERRITFYGGIERARTRPLDPADPFPPPPEDEDHRWSGIQVSLDTRQYRVRPRSGAVAQVSVTQHGGPLGGDADVIRYGVDLMGVVPTGFETALTVASRARLADGPVPSYLRQNLGGINTLRGYEQGEFGGESRWIGWVEERIPLLPQRTFTIRGRVLDFTVDLAVFADVGAIWEGRELLDGRARARWGGGAGLRLLMPWVDIVRFDVATDGRGVRVYGSSGLRL